MVETWLCPTPLPSSKVQWSCMGCWTRQHESGSGQEAATGSGEAGCGLTLLLQFPGKQLPVLHRGLRVPLVQPIPHMAGVPETWSGGVSWCEECR